MCFRYIFIYFIENIYVEVECGFIVCMNRLCNGKTVNCECNFGREFKKGYLCINSEYAD
jgi:hypothetical protein